MPLPRVIARFNKRVSNRFIEPIARRSSGFAVVHHLGRRSGKEYSTPVNLFALDDDAVVSLTYGPSADWLQNVLAGGGTVEDVAGLRRIESARIIGRTAAWPALPLVVRGVLRIMRVHEFLHLSFHGHEAHEDHTVDRGGNGAIAGAESLATRRKGSPRSARGTRLDRHRRSCHRA